MNTKTRLPWINGGTIKIEVLNGITCLREYDAKGNEIHFRDSKEYEAWREYDANGNEIHYKDSDEYEAWSEYDGNGKRTHYKNSDGGIIVKQIG